ncbi:MAG: dienelactone hydrolase family protein [Alphaproteobacteria bacterium]
MRWTALLLIAALAGCAHGAPSNRQDVALMSWTHGFIDEVGIPTEGDLQYVKGSLMLPHHLGSGRVPAVVMLHSGVGQGSQDWFYARLLNEWGIAVLAIDSFSPRNVKNTVGDQSLVSEGSILADAFAGLNYLSEHPNIDANRIAAMGFSKGATPTLLAGLTRYRDRLAHGDNRFAAHVGYYPWCGFAFINHKTTGSPILVMSGENDLVTPADLCEKLVERWALSNPDTDIEMITYPDAGHAFEYPHPFLEMVGDLPVYGELPRDCFIAETEPEVFTEMRSRIRIRGNTLRSALDLCATWSHKAYVQFSEPAQIDSRERLRAFMQRTLLTRPHQQATVGSSQ